MTFSIFIKKIIRKIFKTIFRKNPFSSPIGERSLYSLNKSISSNYGETGLLEVPTARLMPEGSFKIGLNSSFPYEVTALSATPFSWLEATFRYTELKNQKYLCNCI